MGCVEFGKPFLCGRRHLRPRLRTDNAFSAVDRSAGRIWPSGEVPAAAHRGQSTTRTSRSTYIRSVAKPRRCRPNAGIASRAPMRRLLLKAPGTTSGIRAIHPTGVVASQFAQANASLIGTPGSTSRCNMLHHNCLCSQRLRRLMRAFRQPGSIEGSTCRI